MKIVADAQIPFLRGWAERLGEVTYVPGAAISKKDVQHADALIVRTRTRCDSNLLEGTNVQFIATATIGYDHVDLDYLHRAGIGWANCPGCNAASVAQYVRSCLLLLAAHGAWDNSVETVVPLEKPAVRTEALCGTFARLTLGIVGAGHVGEQVAQMADNLGFGRILRCDPPRAEREGAAEFMNLEEVAAESDIVTFHTPLTRLARPHATFHLASADFFNWLKRGAVLFNSSRGEVVDTEALKEALRKKRIRAAVVDTWENEPHIDLELLRLVFVGTPHIAGYSADGKACGTRMALQALARHFGKDVTQFDDIMPPSLPAGYAYYPEGEAKSFGDALRLYDPTRDCLALRAHPDAFEKLRGNYPLRRERAK